MWGIRAIRVGVLLCGLLVVVAGSGCCNCCQNLWGTKSAPPAKAEPQPDGTAADQKDWHRGGWFKDQPSHLTPEKIHGGIY